MISRNLRALVGLFGLIAGLASCTRQSPVVPSSAPSTAGPQRAPTQSTIATPGSSQEAGRPFQFRDATHALGLTFTRFDDMQGENRNQEANGGGVALTDFDRDGILDLFFTQGNRLPRTSPSTEFTNQMFWQQDGLLRDVTLPAGLTAHGFFTGCTSADFDEDGFPDLFVSAYGRSRLYRNNGDGSFQDVSEASGAAVDSWSSSAAFGDVNGDGFLDLYVATYIDAHDDPPRICREPRSPTGTMQCSPTLFGALDDVLLLNEGTGAFRDVSQAAGITAPDGKGLGVLACDLTGDGRLDLHVANDTTPSFLYVNETSAEELGPESTLHIPRFADRGTEFGVATNGEGKITAAMGIAHGDYDRDGWTDLFVTNFYLETNTLFRNLQGRGFLDQSSASRLGPPSRSTLAFGTEFLDVDHDGWLDLMVSTGHIEDRDWTGIETYRMRPHLFRNERNGRFTDVAATSGAYFDQAWVGRGLAVGDLDRDGDLDLILAHQIDPSAILLNETPRPASSVIIRPVGRSASPRTPIGMRVWADGVTPELIRDLSGGGSFQSASAPELHFPLGTSTQFQRLVCLWPDGQRESWTNVTPGDYVAIQGRGLIPVSR